MVAWGDGAEKLRAIDPPDAAKQAHDGLVQATDDVRGAFEGLRPGAEDAADATALQDLLNNADTTAFDSFSTACQALQDLADQNTLLCSSPADEAGGWTRRRARLARTLRLRSGQAC